MAYVDRQSASKRAASLASAAIIQGGIGVMLIYGLATTIDRKEDTTLVATDIRTTPTEQPSEKIVEPTKPDQSVVTAPTPPLDTAQQTDNWVKPVDEIPIPDRVVIADPVLPPHIPPPKAQLFTPRAPKPLNAQSLWVTTEDYPSNELRLERTGTVKYRVVVATSGKVSSCEIVRSSGFPNLDKAACTNVSRRAKFEPATDDTGAKTVDTFSGTVTWRIPED